MKVLLYKEKEMVATRPNGREKGSKVVEVEATVYWVIESDENQAILVRCREVLQNETKSNFEFNGIKCINLGEEYYGKVSHCIHAFVEKQIANENLDTDIKVWEKIENTLRNLADCEDLSKFLRDFKR